MEVQAGVVDVNGMVRMCVQGDVGISRHLCRYEDWGVGCMYEQRWYAGEDDECRKGEWLVVFNEMDNISGVVCKSSIYEQGVYRQDDVSRCV